MNTALNVLSGIGGVFVIILAVAVFITLFIVAVRSADKVGSWLAHKYDDIDFDLVCMVIYAIMFVVILVLCLVFLPGEIFFLLRGCIAVFVAICVPFFTEAVLGTALKMGYKDEKLHMSMSNKQ